MSEKFEPHEPPYRSRLEKWRDGIIEMRTQNWPYSRISAWLRDEKQISISAEAVRKFCRLRKIQKGELPTTASKRQHRPRQTLIKNREVKLFEYDGNGPIETDRE